jgi:hypothetical protein
MFRALSYSSSGRQHKRHLVYCVHVVSWLARNITSAVCAANPEDEQVMLETCRDP